MTVSASPVLGALRAHEQSYDLLLGYDLGGLRSVHAVALGVEFLLACGCQQQRDGLLLTVRFDLPDRQPLARPASTASSTGQGHGGLGEGGESLAEAPGVAVAWPDPIGDGA